MVFKRRDKRSYPQLLRDVIYPRGGLRRAVQYVLHRMRRLPDPKASPKSSASLLD